MQAVLMHALQLRRSFREVFLLCDIQRHSVSEAAAILGISRTAANRRLLLARRRMGEVIESLCGKQQAEHFEIKANVEESCKSGAEGGILLRLTRASAYKQAHSALIRDVLTTWQPALSSAAVCSCFPCILQFPLFRYQWYHRRW
jgi:predicted DNA-binding protein (UPF0251 family)